MQDGERDTMRWQLHWQDAGGTLRIECSGALTADRAAALREELLADMRIYAVRTCIADVRALDFDLLSAASLRTLAHGHGRVPDAGNDARIGLVVRGRRAYGLCRMYVALSSLIRAPGTIEVFTEVAAALEWAHSSRDGDGGTGTAPAPARA